MKSQHDKQRNLKLAAAVLGGGVLVVMGVLTAAAGGGGQHALTQPTTETLPTAPTEIETSVAEPSVTATTSQGEFPETPTVDSDVEPTVSTPEEPGG